MKKLMFMAICVMAVMMGCKQKGQTAAADGKDSVAAVIDSIIEENDTTPLPMFLIGNDGQYMQMLYWSNIEEPQKSEGDDEYFDDWHRSWEYQEMFRRNAAQYTNLIRDNKIVKIKFIDEVLKDPDGKAPSTGEIHRQEIPSLCARFDCVNSKDKNLGDGESLIDRWGLVICTDSYLNSRKMLHIKSCQNEDYNYPKLSGDVVSQLEKEYGMKAKTTAQTCIIGDRYTMGVVEFEGEYKNAPKDKYDADRKFALALEVLIDSGKVFKIEELGYYDETYGSSWNADADGYIPNTVVAAFEGPKGLELCYTHGAPESFCVGMIYLRDGKLVEHQYEMYHALVDEEIPVWKKDIAEMQKLFLAAEGVDRTVTFTKWAHCYIDYSNEWIWLRDKDEKNGAFFIRQDGKYKLIAVETPKLKPSRGEKDGKQYLSISGSAGGPSIYSEIFAFKNGQQVEHFTALFVYGEIDECGLNGKDLTKEEGKAYCDNLPKGEKITAYFKDIEAEN